MPFLVQRKKAEQGIKLYAQIARSALPDLGLQGNIRCGGIKRPEELVLKTRPTLMVSGFVSTILTLQSPRCR
jgi:hypothetical protein